MEVFERIADVRKRRWTNPSESWGFVPTMGFLHDGHISLVKKAREENDHVGVSIFVNPKQFNRKSDFDSYPIDIDSDLERLKEAGADLVWIPDAHHVYPDHFQTYVDVAEITKELEGAARPGHFKGVTTIVSILFNVFQPTRAYFGQKDAQQVAVIQRMVKDLQFNLDIIVCPTMREKDGLAMSSRNVNLSTKARKQAPVLYQSLLAAQKAIETGERSCAVIRNKMVNIIKQAELANIDYVSTADPITLKEIETIKKGVLISLAVYFGEVRLIDNLLLDL